PTDENVQAFERRLEFLTLGTTAAASEFSLEESSRQVGSFVPLPPQCSGKTSPEAESITASDKRDASPFVEGHNAVISGWVAGGRLPPGKRSSSHLESPPIAPGSQRTATRRISGTASLSSSAPLPTRSGKRWTSLLRCLRAAQGW